MSHLGFLSFPGTGHLNPLAALGRRLQQRGHQVTVFQIADLESAIRTAGLDFIQIGHNEFPPGTLRRLDQKLGQLSGFAAVRYTANRILGSSMMVLEEAPKAMVDAQIDALIVDQAELAGGTIAEYLNLPFVNVALAMPIHLEADVPFFAFNWRHGMSPLHKLRNQLGNLFIEHLASTGRAAINRYRERWRLPAIHRTNEFFSGLAQITQLPRELDFPGRKLPACFHYTGPFIDARGRKPVDFPWHLILADRPLIYASMGTLQNGVDRVFHVIAEACAELDAQLVLTLGAGADSVTGLAGKPIVVPYAPQLELLQRSALSINHGGLNTVLESLSVGVPMVVIPVTNDQPGIGARVEWSGTGKAIPVQRLTVKSLRRAVCSVLETPSYRNAARFLQANIVDGNGLERATDIVEQALGLTLGNGSDKPRPVPLRLQRRA
jgi:zeaxanthin glucosyltransferase